MKDKKNRPESTGESLLPGQLSSPRGEQEIYEIYIEGHLNPAWSELLGGFTVTNLENGETLLTGPAPDQSALHGLLARVRDMNLKLVLVRKKEV